jgi:hypothetical protein
LPDANRDIAKHYVLDHDVLRFWAATNNVSQDYSIPKAVEKLDALTKRETVLLRCACRVPTALLQRCTT